MADWISPTGYNDPDVGWTSEWKIYDGSIIGLAYGTPYLVDPGAWSSYVELTHDELLCSKVRVYMQNANDTNPYIEIGVWYDSTWNSIFTGTITKSVWVEKSIGSTENVDKMRVRWYNDTGEIMVVRFREADFYGTVIVPTAGAMTENTGYWGQVV